MRSFPSAVQSPYYAQFLPADNSRPQARASTSTNQDDISRIKSEILEGIDMSTASIESELKRIESFFTNDTKTLLKDFGSNFGRLERQRDTVDFSTASFNSKENNMRTYSMMKSNNKMPALFEVASDNCQLEDSNNSSLYVGEQASEDMHGQSALFGHDTSISSSIKKYQERLKNNEKINMSLQSEIEEHLDTFGMRKYQQIETKHTQQNKNKLMPPLASIPASNKSVQEKQSKKAKLEEQQLESFHNEEQSSNDSTTSNSRRRETSPRSGTDSKRIPSMRTLSTEAELSDIDYYLKHLMIPRRMKISIGGVPFQEVIFVLALKFFDKSSYFENFVFEWLDVQTMEMIGYIKCDYIKFVHKQAQKRFNVACKEPRNEEEEEEEEEVLHHVHVEADSPAKCELYVNGLNAVIKYMEKSIKAPNSL